MSFYYSSGTASSIANWFATFQTWITTTVGWTLVAGGGTQNLVISSPGECGLRTKLFVNVYQGGGGDVTKVYGQVQDDAGGTHKTSYASAYADAGSDGTNPFRYWIAADLDAMCFVFETNEKDDYRAVYVGLLIPLAKTLLGEEYMMCTALCQAGGQILRNYDRQWSQGVTCYTSVSVGRTDPNPVDNALTIAGLWAERNNETAGQFKHISGKINVNEVDLEDEILTGSGGRQTRWKVLAYNGASNLFALRMSGSTPVGVDDESAFQYTSGIAASASAWFSTLETWLTTTVGWTVESGTGTTNIVFKSPDLGGGEYIYINIYISGTALYARARNAAGSQQTTALQSPAGFNTDEVFPTHYYMAADEEVLCFTFNYQGSFRPFHVGRFRIFAQTLPSADYESGVFGFLGSSTGVIRLLRAQETSERWDEGLSVAYDISSDTNPNLFDDDTYSLWPIVVYSSALSDYPVGELRYIYKVQGTMGILDTIRAGNKVYTVFYDSGPSYWWAMRTQ